MKTKLIYIFFTICLLMVSCKKEKTSWDTDWSIPIAQGTIDLSNLVSDSSISVNANNSYQLTLEQSLYAIKLDTLITIPDTNFIEVVALNFPVNATPGFQFAQNTVEHHFDMNGAEIKFLRFKQGNVHVKIESPLTTVTKYVLEIPNATKNGIPFSHTVVVPPGSPSNQSVVEVDLDFSGYDGDLRGIDLNSSNKILTKLIAKVDESGEPVTVTPSDQIKFTMTFSNLLPDYAQGYFGNQVIEDTSHFNLEALKKITAGHLKLESVNFDFIIENGIKATGIASLDLLNGFNNSNGTNIQMTHPEINQNLNINPATGTWASLVPSEKILHFDDNNSNAKDFIENLPDSLELAYNLEINPNGNISAGTDAFYPQSNLDLKIKMDMPLSLSTDSLTYQDTLDFKLNQNFDNSHIYDGSILLEYENYFPFSGFVNAKIIDINNNVLMTLSLDNGIEAGILDGFNVVNTPTINTADLNLSHDQIMLLNSGERIVLEVIFDTPAYPNTVSIYDHYKLKVKLKSNIGATIKF